MYSCSLQLYLPDQKILLEVWKSTKFCYNKIQQVETDTSQLILNRWGFISILIFTLTLREPQ